MVTGAQAGERGDCVVRVGGWVGGWMAGGLLTCGSGVTSPSSQCPALQGALAHISIRMGLPIGRELDSLSMI